MGDETSGHRDFFSIDHSVRRSHLHTDAQRGISITCADNLFHSGGVVTGLVGRANITILDQAHCIRIC